MSDKGPVACLQAFPQTGFCLPPAQDSLSLVPPTCSHPLLCSLALKTHRQRLATPLDTEPLLLALAAGSASLEFIQPPHASLIRACTIQAALLEETTCMTWLSLEKQKDLGEAGRV